MRNTIILAIFSLISISNIQCQWFKNLNAFSIEDDKKLGLQVSQEIAANPSKYPLLPEAGNAEVYNFIRGITNSILNSGRVVNRNAFKWEVKIIKDDKTLNAFCTPGGYIYVYTGIIKYLDKTDELAGVLGHEIAHADKRHSTKQLTKVQGASIVGQILSGNNQYAQIATELLIGGGALAYSRANEAEADKFSVIYLCNSGYSANGAAGFFSKIKGKGSSMPEFLSTHPDPGNRIRDIEALSNKLRCAKNTNPDLQYARIKSLL